VWASEVSIGGLLNFYSLGWWIILCSCMAIYGIFRTLKVKPAIVEKVSFLTIFFIPCIIYTILSVLFMFHTGRDDLVSARAIFGEATVWGGGFVVIYYLIHRFKKNNKARNIFVSLAFIAAVYIAADGLRVMLFFERNFGCAAQAEEKAALAEEKRLAEQRAKEGYKATANDLSIAPPSVIYVPHFWQRFFETSQCPELI
jgi:hypothetical protein